MLECQSKTDHARQRVRFSCVRKEEIYIKEEIPKVTTAQYLVMLLHDFDARCVVEHLGVCERGRGMGGSRRGQSASIDCAARCGRRRSKARQQGRRLSQLPGMNWRQQGKRMGESDAFLTDSHDQSAHPPPPPPTRRRPSSFPPVISPHPWDNIRQQTEFPNKRKTGVLAIPGRSECWPGAGRTLGSCA